MTEMEKVVQKLEEVIAEAVYPDRPRKFMMPLELAEDALALLRSEASAQEPVEPKKVNRYIDFDGEGHPYNPETYDCGACGNELPWKANYCPMCGRAVKWE